MQPVYINHIASIHPDPSGGEEPYLSACEPDYKAVIANPTLRRRMSRIIKMGVACGLECMGATVPEEIGAIITATGLGCLTDTEKFLNAMIDNGERMLNPTPFIQSTFNTIGAQIALLCRIQAYNMTYVHRGLSFESALLDAMMRIAEGDNKVLVGAVDEITPARISDDLTRRVQTLTSAIYDILGCSGIIRVDYIITAGDKINLLEVNTTPGMTTTSFIPQQVRAAGLDIKEVMTDIIENKFSHNL